MLGRRRKRRANNKTTVGQWHVFAGWFSVDPTFAIRQWYSARRGICLATARCRANVPDVGPALARANAQFLLASHLTIPSHYY